MLAASIMAPSAMDRADSFSKWGFPDSSSSTTYEAAGQSRGREFGGAGVGGTIRYISVLLQRDLAVVVRVVHMEEDWEGQGEHGRVRGAPSHCLCTPAPGVGQASHLSFSFRKRSSCSSSMFISMGLK